MTNNIVNQESIHIFSDGYQVDLHNNADSNKSYQKGINGRLYSHNGVISFSSLNGTKHVYENSKIVKVLGGWGFSDEMILLCKIEKGHYTPPTIDKIEKDFLISKNFSIDIEHNEEYIQFNDLIDQNIESLSIEEDVIIPPTKSSPVDNNEFCEDEETEIDYSDYFTTIPTDDIEVCDLSITEFENNVLYDDMILSIKEKDGVYTGVELWKGWLNFDINSKIVCHGIHENIYYKRIYFSDYTNVFRHVNILNSNLSVYQEKNFRVFQNTVLLEPIIDNIKETGSVKAMSVMYTYRLISEDGQTTEFSPFSEMIKIVRNNENSNFSGGDVSEITNKEVVIKINIPEYKYYYEVECVAIEYEAKNAPTGIVSLGRKKVKESVLFNHVGNESFLTSIITATDILFRKNNFKYVSDIDSILNVLLVSGLRNDPLTSIYKQMKKDFVLHGWDEDGESHGCLYNPDPERFSFIKPTSTQKFYYIKKKFYKKIFVFQKSEIEFINKNTDYSISINFDSSDLKYIDITKFIYDWLSDQQDLDDYPNLEIEWEGGIVFKPINPATPTDMSNYVFKFSNTQIIEDADEEIEFINLDTSGYELMNGAQSLGYNQGNGIRVTYDLVDEELAISASDHEATPLINYTAPSLKRSFMKGEYYRLGLNLFDTEGYQLFTIPLGDIKIPKIGMTIKVFNSGENIITKEVRNFYESETSTSRILNGVRLVLNVDVRINCDLKKHISMVQLSYVERTEENRTILCQGISGPMQKIAPYPGDNVKIRTEIANKWSLPYAGGFTYDQRGIDRYDESPYSDAFETNWTRRIRTNRSLIYIDSPDIIYNQISEKYITNGKIERVMRVKTDFSLYREDNSFFEEGNVNIDNLTGDISNGYGPKGRFSRCIYYNNIVDPINTIFFIPHSNHIDWWKTAHYKFGVFCIGSNYSGPEIEIERAKILEDGEIVSGTILNSVQDVSNNAMTLQHYDVFYNISSRSRQECSQGWHNSDKYEGWKPNAVAIGKKTLIVKGKEDIFTNGFIGNDYHNIKCKSIADPHNNPGDYSYSYLNFAIVNLKVNNKNSIYGGRTEAAYSSNIYIPVSKTIPVLKESNSIQRFQVEGDTYVSLFIRQKTERSDKYETGEFFLYKNSSHCDDLEYSAATESIPSYYAVVLETQVEAKLNPNSLFYNENLPLNGFKQRDEFINEAYMQKPDLRTFIPMPMSFKDDPNQDNIIAASEVKLAGDYIDNWSIFPVNNFYEMEKDKGTAYNLAKFKNEIYVIQENQTSLLIINPTTMIETESGPVFAKQGDGKFISDKRILSDFGTTIRRSVLVSDFGFCFFDPERKEFVKIDKPLLSSNSLGLHYENVFQNKNITDIEGYFDDFFKESNLRIRFQDRITKLEQNILLSYNEAFQSFNGEYNHLNADVFIPFKNLIYAPKPNSQKNIHLLNKGNILEFFDELKTMTIGITTNINPSKVKIFKAWLGQINIPYKVKKITIETSLGQTREILDTHHRYFIREGVHTVPLKNRNDWDDLRGEWLYLEVEIEKLIEKKIDIFSFTNFVRNSYR